MASLVPEDQGQEFFRKHKGELEMRLGVLAPLLIDLERCRVLSRLEREQVQNKQLTSQEQSHVLITMLEKKGPVAQNKFYEALKSHDHLLVEDLQPSAPTPAVPEPKQGGDAAKTVTKSSLKQKLQNHLKIRFSTVNQHDKKCNVQDMYTDLYIVTGRTGGVSCEHEVAAIDMTQIGAKPSSEDEQVKMADIFKAKSCSKVLTLGIAGVGKTVSVQKFVMDWADDKSNQDIDFVFVFLFRELNLKKGKYFNLLGLLLLFYPDLKDMKTITEFSESKVLLIFDGLDESRLQLNFEEWTSEADKESSLDILISSLIKSMLLPSALIWVTTRPAAASLIPDDLFNLVTEVRGFNNTQIIDFFKKNIKDAAKANSITDHIKKNRSLHIMCHIPVFCSIIASVQDEILRNESKGKGAKTLTEMYTLYSVSQIKTMNEKYKAKMSAEEKGQLLVKLGKLAFKHLEKGTLIFYEKDLTECGIDVTSGTLRAGLCTQIFNVVSASTGEELFSFVHLSVQEFLAALYVLKKNSTHWANRPLVNTMKKTSWLSKHSRVHLYTSAVDEALQSPNGHLDLFVRFLLGLAPMLEPKIRSPLDLILPRLYIREESISKTVQHIKEKIREDISSERIINLFHCLNELGDNTLVEEINRYIKSADEEKLTPAQCSALTYVLLMSTEDLEEFDLKKYLRSQEGFRRMLPVVKVSRKVWLNHCKLSQTNCQTMASVLQRTPSHLRELDMSDNDLQDEGVKLLCAGLRKPQCKLETLRLNQCHLSKASCEMMASVLQRTPSHLRELDMSDNDLQDEGVNLLCVGLRVPQCKLETLRFVGCKLTNKSCEIVALVLQSSNSLMELDLSHNNLGVSGVQLLSKGLSSPHCKLQTLRLNLCHLSKASCEMMASVLQSAPSHLRELDMSDNDLQDEGVELLCVGLRDPQCKLETLRLSGCLITHEGCSLLSSALKSNPSYLKQLDLNYNHPGDSGVRELTDRLNDPGCKLETLRLNQCHLSKASCEMMASVLQRTPSHLRELDMSDNDLQDEGVKLLCVGLSKPQCKLETLRLAGCKLTDESCKAVASALQSSISLKELDLSHNDLKESGVQLLSTGLSSPHCKLTTLRLSKCGISDEGYVLLALTLMSNPSCVKDLDVGAHLPPLPSAPAQESRAAGQHTPAGLSAQGKSGATEGQVESDEDASTARLRRRVKKAVASPLATSGPRAGEDGAASSNLIPPQASSSTVLHQETLCPSAPGSRTSTQLFGTDAESCKQEQCVVAPCSSNSSLDYFLYSFTQARQPEHGIRSTQCVQEELMMSFYTQYYMNMDACVEMQQRPF
ncbi:NACHT, LRR and PYD domains-containing protein 12-like [Sardina pilchardus]|uniref:NACHT, LRR and PYD domains-containing protein 12-like n=1 Tax=Sardina pilchardus TaxID=27697 RepID=UPI002E1062A4